MAAATLVSPLFVLSAARPVRRPATSFVPDEVTDGELVDRARRGDRWAEEALYRRHVRYVAGVAYRLLGRRVDAEDVVQDTFTIALTDLAALRDGSAVRAWLCQIAVRQAHRRFRKRKLLRVLGLDRGADDATLGALASPSLGAEARAELGTIDRALAKIPTAERMAWMLRHVEGFELEEAAQACGCSLATVKRRISAADDKLSVLLGRDRETP